MTTVAPPSTERFIPGDYLVYDDQVEVRIETITPDRARRLLGANVENRNVRASQVDELAAALASGDWMFNGDAIRVSATGKLRDGQHRCLACVKAGVPFDAIVVYGVADEAQATMDIGRKRSVADWLKMKGVKDAQLVAGGLVLLQTWTRDGVINRGSGRGRLTPRSAERLLAAYPDFPEYTYLGRKLGRLGTPSMWVTVGYILHKADRDSAQEFFDGLLSGVGLAHGDARLALRNRLESDREKLGTTVTQAAQAWLTFRAWSRWKQYEPISKLQLPRGGGTFSDPAEWDSIDGDRLRFSGASER